MRRLVTILVFTAFLIGGGCARDANLGQPVEGIFPAEVKLFFRVRGTLSDNDWYFFVFNFSAAPNESDTLAPFDKVSDKDRGRNWELYVLYHNVAGGTARMETLQRPRVPTILAVGNRPTDATAADFSGDGLSDITVACQGDDAVRMLFGQVPVLYDTLYRYNYFAEPVDIAAAAGPAPTFTYAGDFDSDTKADLLVIYAGSTTSPPFMRMLKGDGTGGFTAGADVPLGGPPVDALQMDLNGDSKSDLVVLTRGTGAGETGLRLFTIDYTTGGITAGAVLNPGSSPVNVTSGKLNDDTSIDLAVANSDAGGGNGNIATFINDGAGAFSAGPVVAVPGPCFSAGAGRLKKTGTLDDLTALYTGSFTSGTSTKTGILTGAFLNTTGTFATDPIAWPLGVNPSNVNPSYMLMADTNADLYMDALVLDGALGSGGNTLYIQRGQNTTATPSTFFWDGQTTGFETIYYATGEEPQRIHLADLDKNSVMDLLIPNAGTGQTGKSIAIYYGLGKTNYTSADIYWMDQAAQPLTSQPWYKGLIVGPNSLTLTIDPELFYDLSLRRPTESGFNVNFMTATTGIALADNPDHLGEVRDLLKAPVNVRMEPGLTYDEMTSPRAQEQATDPNEDIDYWAIEVN